MAATEKAQKTKEDQTNVVHSQVNELITFIAYFAHNIKIKKTILLWIIKVSHTALFNA